MALTVGVGTIMDSQEIVIIVTGVHKAYALYKAVEEGVNHMWTVSALQNHARAILVCDEDATAVATPLTSGIESQDCQVFQEY